MKKTTAMLLSFLFLTTITACTSDKLEQQNNTEIPKTAQTQQLQSSNLGKTLVVYFSMPETTDPANMTQEEENSTVIISDEVLGNTQYVANIIQKNTGADIFRIEPIAPYPTDHETLVDLEKKEQNKQARPQLKNHLDNIELYDTVFLGYPNWWGDMPMVLYSFFDEYDLSGKMLIPFNTHGGSGFSDTISTIAELEPSASIHQNGFSISRNDVQEAKDDVIAWLTEIKNKP